MRYAIPAVIAMTASSLYNMVDSIFIGRGVGPLAIAGLAVTFPFMNLSAAFGAMIGVGGSTMISVKLGQKDNDTAVRVLGNVVTLNILLGVIFGGLAIMFLSPILRFFGASDNTIGYAYDYMLVILLGNVVTHLYLGLNSVLRATGYPKKAMNATIATVIINTILDPIFIYGLDMGIRGAAIATVIAQVIALAFVWWKLSDKKDYVHLQRGIYGLRTKIVKNILGIGLSPFCMQTCACLVVILINTSLHTHGGDLAIGGYGIINRITMLFIMICMGFNQGLQPIAGYNYGARQYSRVKEVFILTAKWEVLVTTLCFLVSELIPTQAVSLFTNDPELIRMASKGIKTMNLAFALVGFGMVSGNFFQCLGMVKKSIFLSLTRQLIFLLPLLYTLPIWFEDKGVWMSFPISDSLNIIISAILIINLFRKFNKLNDGDDPATLGSTIS